MSPTLPSPDFWRGWIAGRCGRAPSAGEPSAAVVDALLDAAEEQVTILCVDRGAEIANLGAITLEALGELRRCGEVEAFAELASNLLGLPAIPVDT